MKMGVHLPLMEWGGEGSSLARLQATVDAARGCGFDLVSANDHFLFATPWLDGLTALAAVAGRSGEMTLATTVSLASLRGPVPLAKALAAIDILCDGQLIAGVGPGSSERDYEAIGVPFDQRWERFEEAVAILRSLLRELLAPLLRRDPGELRDHLAIGPAEHCAELLGRYAHAGCERVLFWPLGDEPRQVERLASEVRPLITS
jgi:alkanesulfonate monooxygenase SsuD/methylene tetrahydromethanopterin reductase-like flavin-dependent oxidoreductase (luciferase family)